MLTGKPPVFVSHLKGNPNGSSHLLLLNQAAHQWLLPFVYHSSMFTSSQKLVKFHTAHDVPEERMSERLKLVRNLWIGAEPSNTKRRLSGDLTYASSAWPVTIITRLLLMCESLEHFTLLNLNQNDWKRLEHAIPARLKYLSARSTVLSVSPIYPRILKSNNFTSISTFMRDGEVRDLVIHPTMESFRRLSEAIDTDTLAKFAAEQVECLRFRDL